MFNFHSYLSHVRKNRNFDSIVLVSIFIHFCYNQIVWHNLDKKSTNCQAIVNPSLKMNFIQTQSLIFNFCLNLCFCLPQETILIILIFVIFYFHSKNVTIRKIFESIRLVTITSFNLFLSNVSQWIKELHSCLLLGSGWKFLLLLFIDDGRTMKFSFLVAYLFNDFLDFLVQYIDAGFHEKIHIPNDFNIILEGHTDNAFVFASGRKHEGVPLSNAHNRKVNFLFLKHFFFAISFQDCI